VNPQTGLSPCDVADNASEDTSDGISVGVPAASPVEPGASDGVTTELSPTEFWRRRLLNLNPAPARPPRVSRRGFPAPPAELLW
jgi:hypothetical protein